MRLLLPLLATGLLHAICAPPLHQHWAHPLLWVPALWAFSQLEGRRAFLAGWLVGALGQMALFTWIVPTIAVFAEAPWILALGALAAYGALWGLFAGVFAWGMGAVRRASGRWWVLTLPAWFVACEYLNPQLFPWTVGGQLYRVPELIGFSSLTGLSGLTWLVLVASCLILARIEGDRAALRVGMPVGLAVLVLALGWSQHRLRLVDEAMAQVEPVTVAIVQDGKDIQERIDVKKADKSALVNDLLALSQRALTDHPDTKVLVWAEGAIFAPPQKKNSERHQRIRDFARANQVEIWTGSNWSTKKDGTKKKYNSAFRVQADGTVDPARHDKVILLPFGEFIPGSRVLPFLMSIPGARTITAGEEPGWFQSPIAEFPVLICYEAIRPRFVRAAVNRGATLLTAITYDGWFGDTRAAVQHNHLAVVQSAQYGVPMVRAAATGVSAFVDAAGRVTSQSGTMERTVLVDSVRPVRVPTVYAALGDWFAWLCLLLGFGLVFRGSRSPDHARDRRAQVGVLVFVATAPLAWLINPEVPALDYAVWAAAMGLTAAAVRPPSGATPSSSP